MFSACTRIGRDPVYLSSSKFCPSLSCPWYCSAISEFMDRLSLFISHLHSTAGSSSLYSSFLAAASPGFSLVLSRSLLALRVSFPLCFAEICLAVSSSGRCGSVGFTRLSRHHQKPDGPQHNQGNFSCCLTPNHHLLAVLKGFFFLFHTASFFRQSKENIPRKASLEFLG